MTTISTALVRDQVERADAISREFPERRDAVFAAVLAANLVARLLSDVPSEERTSTVAVRKDITPSELFARLRPGQDTDKVLVAAYFLDELRAKATFTAEELRSLVLEAKVAAPKNVSLAVLRNAQKGTIAQTSKDGRKVFWMITQSGLEVIQQRLQEFAGETKH
jgi:hypothetical protein